MRWLVVSDGSTDRTDEIVSRYAQEHDWIELIEMPERGRRDFEGKASSINAAYARARHLTILSAVWMQTFRLRKIILSSC